MKYCIGLMNIRDIYVCIYTYFNFVRLRHQTVGQCLLLQYIPSIIQYAFSKYQFPMQHAVRLTFCIVLKRCNVQCELEISLKQVRLVLKEHAAYRLQSALHSFK